MTESMTEQEAIETLEIFRNDYTREDSAICRAINIAIDELRHQTVESEVSNGRWIQQESPNGRRFNCSECGHEFTVHCSEMIDPRDYVCYLDDYCGKCGAYMIKEGVGNG